jgi:hypothetical protein
LLIYNLSVCVYIMVDFEMILKIFEKIILFVLNVFLIIFTLFFVSDFFSVKSWMMEGHICGFVL